MFLLGGCSLFKPVDTLKTQHQLNMRLMPNASVALRYSDLEPFGFEVSHLQAPLAGYFNQVHTTKTHHNLDEALYWASLKQLDYLLDVRILNLSSKNLIQWNICDPHAELILRHQQTNEILVEEEEEEEEEEYYEAEVPLPEGMIEVGVKVDSSQDLGHYGPVHDEMNKILHGLESAPADVDSHVASQVKAPSQNQALAKHSKTAQASKRLMATEVIQHLPPPDAQSICGLDFDDPDNSIEIQFRLYTTASRVLIDQSSYVVQGGVRSWFSDVRFQLMHKTLERLAQRYTGFHERQGFFN